MAVISVDEYLAKRTHEIKPRGERRYQRVFLIRTDNVAESEVVVRNALPRLGSIHPDDPGVRLAEVRINQIDDSPWDWEAELTYANNVGADGGFDDPFQQQEQGQWVNLTNQPATLRIKGSVVERVFETDIDNKPLVNTADEPITGLAVTVPVTIYEFTRYLTTYNQNRIQTYQGAINSDAWFGWPPLTAKVESISVEAEHRENTRYWRETIEIHCCRYGWREKVVNAGYMEKVGGNLRPIMVGARMVTRPWPLKENGEKCDPPNRNFDNPDLNTINFLEFKLRPEVSFADLGVP